MSNIPVTVKRGVGTTMIPYLSISFDKDKGYDSIEAAPVRWIYIDNSKNDSIVNVQFTGTPDNGGASIIDSTIINEYSDGYLEVNSNNPYKSFSITLDDASDGKAILNEIKIISADEQDLLQRYAVSITLQENISTLSANYERYKLDTEVALYSHLHCQWAGNANISDIGKIYIWDNNTGISANIETDESTESFGTVIYKEFSPIELTTAGLIQSGGNLNIDIKGFLSGKICIELLDLNNNIVYAGYNIPINTKEIKAIPEWSDTVSGAMKLTYNVNRYSDINYMKIYTLNGEVNVLSLIIFDGDTIVLERSDLPTPDFTGIYDLNKYLFTKIQLVIAGPLNVGVSFECINDISGEIVNVDANTKYFIEGEGIFYSEDIKLEPSSGTAGNTEVTVTVPESTSFYDTTKEITFATTHNKRATLTINRKGKDIYLYNVSEIVASNEEVLPKVDVKTGDKITISNYGRKDFLYAITFSHQSSKYALYTYLWGGSGGQILCRVNQYNGLNPVSQKIISLVHPEFPGTSTGMEHVSIWEAGNYIFILGINNTKISYVAKSQLVNADNGDSISVDLVQVESSSTWYLSKIVETADPNKFAALRATSTTAKVASYYIYDISSNEKLVSVVDTYVILIHDMIFDGYTNKAVCFNNSTGQGNLYSGNAEVRGGFSSIKRDLGIENGYYCIISTIDSYILWSLSKFYILSTEGNILKDISYGRIYDVYNVNDKKLLIAETTGTNYTYVSSAVADVTDMTVSEVEYDSYRPPTAMNRGDILIRDF